MNPNPLFILFPILVLIALIGFHCYKNFNLFQKEGFQNEQQPSQPQTNDTLSKIKAVLDPLITPAKDLCSLFDTITTNMMKNEKAGTSISDSEAKLRVQKNLAIAIPGGALPCPLLSYPTPTSSDLELLQFVQTIPSDFGARIVLMALYARNTLKTQSNKLDAALKGEAVATESFQDITLCPPDIAASRRAEKQTDTKTCKLPEDLSPQDVKESIQTVLKTIVAKKNTILKANSIDPTLSIAPIIQEAKGYATYLNKKAKEAESGDLINSVNIPEKK